MSFKNAIRLYEFLDKFYIAGFFLLLIGVSIVLTKGNYNFFLFGVGIVILLSRFFRKNLLYTTFQKTNYRGAFVSLIDKVGIDGLKETFNSDFSFYENLPIDYSSEVFLKDNSLKTVIEKWYDKSPYIIFNNSTLTIGEKSFNWKSVKDWTYSHGSENVPTRIEINLIKGNSIDFSKEYIETAKLNVSHIDILLLLYHFKKFYG